MKKILLLPFCLLFIFCSNQIKLNKGRDIDIIFPQKYISTQKTVKVVEEVIKNNTGNTYIIDPYGFYGKSYTLENGNALEPYMYLPEGFISKNDRVCKELIIILNPFQTIHHSIVYDINNKALYKYSKNNKYEEVIKSSHNRYNVTLLGCYGYVRQLESKGYKVLEDSIVAKIPLVP